MSRRLLLAIILVLAFLGLADALYLSQAALNDTALVCGINGLDGCNIVAQSHYSRIFGVPNAVYGVVFYSLIFICSVWILLSLRRRALEKLLLWITVLGFLASLYFLYLQLFLIKAFCIYCLASFAISTLLLGGAAWLNRKESAENSAVVP